MRIIMFDIDCLRPDHLGCYGYNRPTSPNIDRVADQGVRFTQYHCASSPCLPSRTEWASGRFGVRNGVVSNVGAGSQFHIRERHYVGPEPDNDMLMRRLRTVGCDPVSFSNFADRHNAWHFMCGWSEFHTPNLKGGAGTAEEVHQPLMRWLRDNATREDYLLHVNYWDTHRCYKMDESWADRLSDYPVTQPWPDEEAIREHQSITGPFTATGQFHDNKSPFPLMPGSVGSRQDFEHMITGYDASIAYVDHHLGIVMEELARQGVLDDIIRPAAGDDPIAVVPVIYLSRHSRLWGDGIHLAHYFPRSLRRDMTHSHPLTGLIYFGPAVAYTRQAVERFGQQPGQHPRRSGSSYHYPCPSVSAPVQSTRRPFRDSAIASE